MKPRHYDIARKENENRLRWLDSAEDLDSAKSRIQELSSFWPGEFQVLDQESHQVVAATGSESPAIQEVAIETRPETDMVVRKPELP